MDFKPHDRVRVDDGRTGAIISRSGVIDGWKVRVDDIDCCVFHFPSRRLDCESAHVKNRAPKKITKLTKSSFGRYPGRRH